jgi:hypothetical protein
MGATHVDAGRLVFENIPRFYHEFKICNIIILDFKLSPFSECFMLFFGNSPASEFSMPTFRNTLFHLHHYLPIKIEKTECSETLAYKIQTPENYPEESIQQTVKNNQIIHNKYTSVFSPVLLAVRLIGNTVT